MKESFKRGGVAARAVDDKELKRKREEARRVRRSRFRIHGLAIGAVGIICVIIAVSTIFYNVQLTHLKGDIEQKNTTLEQLESKNVSLSARQANTFDLDEIEEYAKNVLGLVKMDRSQEEYLELQKTDQVEVNEASSGVDKLVSSFVKSFNAILSFLR